MKYGYGTMMYTYVEKPNKQGWKKSLFLIKNRKNQIFWFKSDFFYFFLAFFSAVVH